MSKLVETHITYTNDLVFVRPFIDSNQGAGVEIDSRVQGQRLYPAFMVDALLDYYSTNNQPAMVKAILGATGRVLQ